MTKRRNAPLVPVGLAGLGLGLVGGLCIALWQNRQPDISHASMTSTGALPKRDSVLPAVIRDQDAESRDRSGGAGDGRQSVADEILSSALMAYFDHGYRQAWATQRNAPPSDQGMLAGRIEFKRTVLELPRRMGAAGAEEACDEETLAFAFENGDGVRLVEACAKTGWEFAETDLTDAFFERVFRSRSSGVTQDGSLFATDSSVSTSDGMTLEFGPGRHRLDSRRLWMEPNHTPPKDLTLVGAGMDSTLLRMGELSAHGAIHRLSFRHLTLDLGNDYFFDLRRGALSLDLEGVRVVRFDMGAGKSVIFGTRQGSLIRARDCEFLGGYGRSPGGGNVFSGDVFIASFTRCAFARLDLNLGRLQKGQVNFVDCVFKEFETDPTLAPDAYFKGCTVLPLLSREELRGLGQRSLTDFFWDWKER